MFFRLPLWNRSQDRPHRSTSSRAISTAIVLAAVQSAACTHHTPSSGTQGVAQSEDTGCASSLELPLVRRNSGVVHELERPPTTAELTWLTQDAATYFKAPYAINFALLPAELPPAFRRAASVLRANLRSNWSTYASHVLPLLQPNQETDAPSTTAVECIELEFGRLVVRAWNLNPVTNDQDYWQRDLQAIADNFAQAMGEIHGEYTRVHQPNEVITIRWAPMRAYLFAHGRVTPSEVQLYDGPTEEPRVITEPCAHEGSPAVPLLFVRAEDDTLVPIDLSWLPSTR